MTQTNQPAVRLAEGDLFPALSAPLLGGGTLSLPGDLAGSWSVVLLYRGDWCPFCRGQLSDFQRHAERYAGAGVKVVALSADTEQAARQTVERHQTGFPVAYGLQPVEVARSHGASASAGGSSTSADGSYLQATGFILRPDGTVALSLYSTGAVGRLNAADTLGFIGYVQSH